MLSRSSHWSQSDLQSTSSVSNINAAVDNNSSESTSSSETLKWLGSMSDVSVSSHATNSSMVSGSGKCVYASNKCTHFLPLFIVHAIYCIISTNWSQMYLYSDILHRTNRANRICFYFYPFRALLLSNK